MLEELPHGSVAAELPRGIRAGGCAVLATVVHKEARYVELNGRNQLGDPCGGKVAQVPILIVHRVACATALGRNEYVEDELAGFYAWDEFAFQKLKVSCERTKAPPRKCGGAEARAGAENYGGAGKLESSENKRLKSTRGGKGKRGRKTCEGRCGAERKGKAEELGAEFGKSPSIEI
jgi:hypothetical protein